MKTDINPAEAEEEIVLGHLRNKAVLAKIKEGARNPEAFFYSAVLIKSMKKHPPQQQKTRFSPFIKDMLLLSLALLFSGGLSVLMGQDISVDLLNYHLYIPFSFLHQRFFWDVIPAGIHTFFNPLLDIPYYILFTVLNGFPRLTAFIQGLWYGLFLFLAWKITAVVFPPFTRAQDKLIRLNAFILATTGIAALSQIGLSSNELALAVAGLLACYLLLKTPQKKNGSFVSFYLSFFILGAFFGLKYTFGPSAAGLGIMGLYILFKRQVSWYHLAGCLAACAGGFLLTNGFFMWRLFHLFGNPFFPFFNQWFQSPFFDPINLSNGPGTPSSWREWLFLPFLRRSIQVVEYQLDIRLCLGVLSFIVLTAVMLLSKLRRKQNLLPEASAPLLILFGINYILWLSAFSVMRYSILLEFTSALLFIVLIQHFLGKATGGALCVFFTLYILLTPPPDWGRSAFGNKNSTAVIPAVEDNALVLLGGHVSFLAALANPKAKYIGGIWFPPGQYPQQLGLTARRLNILQPDDYRFHFEDIIHKTISSHHGPLYIMGPDHPVITDNRSWEKYHIRLDEPQKSCQKFSSNLDNIYGGFILCPAQKTPQK